MDGGGVVVDGSRLLPGSVVAVLVVLVVVVVEFTSVTLAGSPPTPGRDCAISFKSSRSPGSRSCSLLASTLQGPAMPGARRRKRRGPSRRGRARPSVACTRRAPRFATTDGALIRRILWVPSCCGSWWPSTVARVSSNALPPAVSMGSEILRSRPSHAERVMAKSPNCYGTRSRPTSGLSVKKPSILASRKARISPVRSPGAFGSALLRKLFGRN